MRHMLYGSLALSRQHFPPTSSLIMTGAKAPGPGLRLNRHQAARRLGLSKLSRCRPVRTSGQLMSNFHRRPVR